MKSCEWPLYRSSIYRFKWPNPGQQFKRSPIPPENRGKSERKYLLLNSVNVCYFYRSTERKKAHLCKENHYSASLQVISSNKAMFSWLNKNMQFLLSFLQLVRSSYINSQKTAQTCITTVLSEFTSVNKWWIEHNAHSGCACVRCTLNEWKFIIYYPPCCSKLFYLSLNVMRVKSKAMWISWATNILACFYKSLWAILLWKLQWFVCIVRTYLEFWTFYSV